MPYVFRIHKQSGGKAPNPSTFINGWGASTLMTGALLDEIETGTTVNRMGTSIPSIFARPMLFQTAFDTITPTAYHGSGINQKLISEVFDMLEFIYQNAGNKRLSTVEWVSATQIAELKKAGSPELQRLASVLEDHLVKIGNPGKITLFFWEDYNAQGVKVKTLIGGTSISTLVFTSPNWSRKVKENGWVFRRLDGTKFFDDSIQPLSDRSHAFREMMFNLRITYDTEFQAQCGGSNSGMAQYIWETISHMGLKIPSMPKAQFLTDYPAVHGVYAGAIPISHKALSALNSGYCIKVTSQRYAHKIGAGGAAVNVPVPMALNDNGLPGVEYVGGATWQPTYSIDEAYVRTNPQIFARELPGEMGVSYPWLSAADLLEDRIIKVNGTIDNASFITLFNGDSQYLLPIRRQFFDFFNVNDLKGVDAWTGRPLAEISVDGANVVVTLNIPIVDAAHKFIALTRTYTPDKIVATDKPIEVGFFPFYKVPSQPALDTYSVMLAAAAKTTLEFFTLTTDETVTLAAPGKERTKEQLMLNATTYYDVRGTIDLVEVVLPDGGRGLIIPKMKGVTPGNIDYKFAVDFGTSNTFIAYKKDGEAEIKTLSFGDSIVDTRDERDNQTVFLYAPENIPTMVDTFQREFMLPTLGQADSIAGFPIKTSVCEVTQFENEPSWNLFGNINMGFKFKNEISSGNVPNTRYFTNLKWALEEDPGASLPGWRALAFCKQILWLLKNKALLNGGKSDFKVMLTFPESMIDRSVFLDLMAQTGVWYEAAREVGLDPTSMFDASVTESEAPYYMVVTGQDNMLNVDIGGGTTDMFLVRRLDKQGMQLPNPEAYYLSVKFAADDLWGDGAGARKNTVGQNGFCQYLQKKIKANGGSIDGITKLVSRSSDVMAALFSNDVNFKTSLHIRQNNNLRSILLIHYTALLFAIGRLLNKMDAGIPRVLSFTGMGSKYLSLISTDPRRLKEFTAEVLSMITGAPVPHGFQLDTHYMDAKEVTAKGALSKDNVEEAYHINDNFKHSFTDLGCESYDFLRYAQLRTGTEINTIRQDSRKVFDRFVSLLESTGFGKITASQFQLSIPAAMLDDLKQQADLSFNNVQGAISPKHDQSAVTDNLFFWFLKDSLCKLSMAFHEGNPTK